MAGAIKKTLPADPEGMNNDRAEWAGSAVRQFQIVTGADFEDAVSDLITNLHHWCDRNGLDFEEELAHANKNYAEETAEL